MLDSTTHFCAYVLLPDIENYRGDAFTTYRQLEKMDIGEKAIIFTRKCGCEFIAKKDIHCRVLWDTWKSYAVNIFEITRTIDMAFHLPAVEYTNISPEIAEKIIEEWENLHIARNVEV